jgi:aspartate racemase
MILKKKTIGILGGMGPGASADLYQRIIVYAQKKYRAEQDYDYPPMIIYNLPLIGFSEMGFENPDIVKQQLIAGVKKLEQAGSDFIAIACNTVHYFYDDMQAAVNIPIINIMEATVARVREKNYGRVGVLCSESMNKLGLYQTVLANSAIESHLVDESKQKILNSVILHVMSGSQGPEQKEQIKKIIDDFTARGDEAIILGCTELPLAITQKDLDTKLFDSTQILAETVLEYAYSKNDDYAFHGYSSVRK